MQQYIKSGSTWELYNKKAQIVLYGIIFCLEYFSVRIYRDHQKQLINSCVHAEEAGKGGERDAVPN